MHGEGFRLFPSGEEYNPGPRLLLGQTQLSPQKCAAGCPGWQKELMRNCVSATSGLMMKWEALQACRQGDQRSTSGQLHDLVTCPLTFGFHICEMRGLNSILKFLWELSFHASRTENSNDLRISLLIIHLRPRAVIGRMWTWVNPFTPQLPIQSVQRWENMSYDICQQPFISTGHEPRAVAGGI
jgi:hypothetical protein